MLSRRLVEDTDSGRERLVLESGRYCEVNKCKDGETFVYS